MPTEIDVYIEHVISLSKDYSILFDKYIKLEEKCRILEERILEIMLESMDEGMEG